MENLNDEFNERFYDEDETPPPIQSIDEAAKDYALELFKKSEYSPWHNTGASVRDFKAGAEWLAEHQARQQPSGHSSGRSARKFERMLSNLPEPEEVEQPVRKTLDDLIKTIQINWSNMDHIRKFGVINGTLKSEIIRVAETHAKSKAVEPQHPHIEATSENLIGRVKDRFKELKGKEFDWRSFYHGWIEGRADWNFKHQARQQPVRKTLDECKDEVVETEDVNLLKRRLEFYRSETAKIRDYVFDDANKCGYPTQSIFEAITDKIDALKAELYASQAKAVEPQGGWVDVKDRLPIPNQFVLLSDNEDVLLGVFRFLPTSLTANGFDLFDSRTDRYTPDEITHWKPFQTKR